MLTVSRQALLNSWNKSILKNWRGSVTSKNHLNSGVTVRSIQDVLKNEQIPILHGTLNTTNVQFASTPSDVGRCNEPETNVLMSIDFKSQVESWKTNWLNLTPKLIIVRLSTMWTGFWQISVCIHTAASNDGCILSLFEWHFSFKIAVQVRHWLLGGLWKAHVQAHSCSNFSIHMENFRHMMFFVMLKLFNSNRKFQAHDVFCQESLGDCLQARPTDLDFNLQLLSHSSCSIWVCSWWPWPFCQGCPPPLEDKLNTVHTKHPLLTNRLLSTSYLEGGGTPTCWKPFPGCANSSAHQ